MYVMIFPVRKYFQDWFPTAPNFGESAVAIGVKSLRLEHHSPCAVSVLYMSRFDCRLQIPDLALQKIWPFAAAFVVLVLAWPGSNYLHKVPK